MDARFALLAALACVFYHIATPAAVPELASLGGDELERIVGGKSAAAGQFPYAVALYQGTNFICTASIIGEEWVLTAAHCVSKNRAAANYYAIANVNRKSPTVRLDFELIIVHGDYKDGKFDHDIALLRVRGGIVFKEDVQPVCISRQDTPMYEYRNATAMGWGNTSPSPITPIIPDNLQYLELSILEKTNSQCRNLGVTDCMICAGGESFKGVCNGDSGGPFVYLSSDKPPCEIGVVSYGSAIEGCGRLPTFFRSTSSPTVFTRVSCYFDWIVNNTAHGHDCVV